MKEKENRYIGDGNETVAEEITAHYKNNIMSYAFSLLFSHIRKKIQVYNEELYKYKGGIIYDVFT